MSLEGIRLDEEAIAQASREAAGALRAMCSPGDIVAAQLGNEPDFVVARDAATIADLFFLPINPRLTEREVAVLLAAARPRAVITDVAALRAAAPPALPARKPPGAIGATLLFTSGTTGVPKGCMRSAAQEAARAAEITATYGLGPADVHLVACPLAHSAPGIFLRAARAAGARSVLMPRFDARAFLAAVRRWRATISFLVPTQVERLLALPADERGDLAPLRAVVVAGAPFAPASRARFLDWLGPGRLWEFYGSSETGTITILPPAHQEGAPAGFVGWPAPGVELRLVDGEIFVRSPTVMTGYLGEPPLEGFVSVGDLGRLREDGGLTLVDRKHDTIITGGMNVHPAEVERALAEHAGVAAAVVCGLPHPDWGEEVAALVAPRPGAALDAAELRAFLHERIAGFKVPKRFVMVPLAELPLGASGKPLRRLARSRFP